MTIASTLRIPLLLIASAATLVTACATAEDDGLNSDLPGNVTGGVSGSGASTSSSTGASTGSGGVFGATGGTGSAASGGSASGGAASGGAASGGAASGGASTGGAATGGTGTGGTFDTGQCAGKPTFDTWKNGSGMTGDQVIITCSVAQSGCAGLETGVPYLWECTASHVPNCETQKPQDGSAWKLLGDCTDTGMGGASN